MRSENLWDQTSNMGIECEKPKPADLQTEGAYRRRHWLYRFFVSKF